MNFYPIYKNKKLLPWIKWWILKGNKVMPKHLSEWINSASAITLTGVYKGSPLLYLNLKGNTSQTGTPTPEAPVPVNVVKYDNYININDESYRIDLGGKNLLNNTLLTQETTKNGVKATPNSDGSITLDGTASGNVYINLCRLDFGTTSFNSVLGGSTEYVASTSNPSTLARIVYDSGNKFTYILVYNGTTVENLTIYPMIEKGTQATAFSPYVANPIELCKIGDYQDVIYKENNKWYVDKYIEKIVLNGTETFTSDGDYVGAGRFEIQNYLGKGGSAGNPNCLCNYYNGSFDTNNGSIFVSGVNSRISIINHSFRNNLEGFKTWLAENKPIVYYVLPTSETSEITETNLISQLEAIYNAKLQSGTNTIMQLPSDLPFYLNFQYYEKG